MNNIIYLGAKHPVEIGLFIPCAEDSSNIVANIVATRIVNETKYINLRIFKVEQKICISEVSELKKRQLLHSDILKRVIFPFQISKGLSGNPDGVLLCPELLEKKYPNRVHVESVKNVNNAKFINDRITNNRNLKMAFSVRNLQIFHNNFIDSFAKKGECSLINAHPAALPDMRGLEGPFWTRMCNINEYTTTLHKIVREIDSGDIIDYTTSHINKIKDQPIAHYTRDTAPELANMIFKQVHLRFIRNGSHNGINIQKGDIRYYTTPSAKEVEQALDMGLTITNAEKQINWLINNYSNKEKNLKHYIELLELILNYYRKFDESLFGYKNQFDKIKLKNI